VSFDQLRVPMLASFAASAGLSGPSRPAGWQPHRFGTFPPPHVLGAVHVPQSSVPPHPSGMVPQLAPSAAHVLGVQPHVYGVVPPPHVSGKTHGSPQSSAVPHPSSGLPHVAPSWPHVCGEQMHWPPTQVSYWAQSPQNRVSPQELVTVPHTAPAHVEHAVPPVPPAPELPPDPENPPVAAPPSGFEPVVLPAPPQDTARSARSTRGKRIPQA